MEFAAVFAHSLRLLWQMVSWAPCKTQPQRSTRTWLPSSEGRCVRRWRGTLRGHARTASPLRAVGCGPHGRMEQTEPGVWGPSAANSHAACNPPTPTPTPIYCAGNDAGAIVPGARDTLRCHHDHQVFMCWQHVRF